MLRNKNAFVLECMRIDGKTEQKAISNYSQAVAKKSKLLKSGKFASIKITESIESLSATNRKLTSEEKALVQLRKDCGLPV